MKTVRRLIYGETLRVVTFVTLGFLALFSFFDLIDELPAVDDKTGYQLHHALLAMLLHVPGYLHELLPITLLIGAIYVMARLAQDSEYTILRTSGMGPRRALLMLLGIGALFAALTFAIGDYVVPSADRAAQLLKARFKGDLSVGLTGAWLKERQGTNSISVNVARMSSDGVLHDIRLFEFDSQAHLVSATRAASAVPGADGWRMSNVQRSTFVTGSGDPSGSAAGGSPLAKVETLSIDKQALPEWRWPTQLTANMVSTALLQPDRMSTLTLFRYIQHLQANGQNAQPYQIAFWRNVFYPLSCLVMVVLALPFAYLHFRSGNITGYVFGGVMAGISFFLLNNVFGFVGNLHNWAPWLTAAAPGLIYTLISLLALRWLVLRQ